MRCVELQQFMLSFSHSQSPVFHLTLPSWLRPFIFNGSSGVALFFILSGFTLCYTYHPVMSTPGSLKVLYQEILSHSPALLCYTDFYDCADFANATVLSQRH